MFCIVIGLFIVSLLNNSCTNSSSDLEFRMVEDSMYEFYIGEEQNTPLLSSLYHYQKATGETPYNSFEEWKSISLERRGSDGVDPLIHSYEPIREMLNSVGISSFNDFKYDLGYPPYLEKWYGKEGNSIKLASEAFTYCDNNSKCDSISNESYIKSALSNRKGVVVSKGWRSKIVGEGIFLVTYSFKENNNYKIYALEVNLPIDGVRNLFDYDLLVDKYWNINQKYTDIFRSNSE